MSKGKTFLSRRFPLPFDFNLVSSESVQVIEKSLDFIPAQRLRAVFDGVGRDRFVHTSGRSWKQVSRYLRGDKAPTEVLEAIAAESGTSMDWLVQGRLRTLADVKFQTDLLKSAANERLSRMLHGRSEPEWSTLGYGLKAIDERLAALADFTPSDEASDRPSAKADTSNLDQPGMIRLPVYSEVEASAGPGAIPAAELADGIMALDRRFLRDQGAAPEHCAVIWARGDSMMPTIPDGSALVVDRSQVEVADGCIMVLNVAGSLLVKRVQRLTSGEIRLISDNRDYEPEVLAQHQLEQLRVIGRVVYFGRTP